MAALRGGARRGVHAGRLWGSDPGAKGWRGLGGLTEARNRARRPCRGGGIEGGEGGAVPVDESMQGSSGTLGSTGSFGVELQSRWTGQGGRNRAGDVEFHGRSTYRRLERRRGGGHRRERTTPDRAQRGRGGGVTMWQRRHDYATVRARRWRAAAVDRRNGGAVENWEEEGNGFIPLAKGTGSKIQPVPM